MDAKTYSTCIVASRNSSPPIGMTGDLRARVLQIKNQLDEGFSAPCKCNRFVWFEQFFDPSNAIAREKQLKRWTRAKKIARITKTNPTWLDLSENW